MIGNVSMRQVENILKKLEAGTRPKIITIIIKSTSINKLKHLVLEAQVSKLNS